MLAIREATAADAPLIVTMIRELAEFERELDQVDATAEDLLREGFGVNPHFRGVDRRVGRHAGRVRALLLHILNLVGATKFVR